MNFNNGPPTLNRSLGYVRAKKYSGQCEVGSLQQL